MKTSLAKPLIYRLCLIFLSFFCSCDMSSNLPPEVVTGDMIEDGQGKIILKGTVNPHGSWTMVWFEYGETTSYGDDETATDVMYAGSETIEVSAEFEASLDYHKTFHYRIAAENENGTSFGDDKTFLISESCKNC